MLSLKSKNEISKETTQELPRWSSGKNCIPNAEGTGFISGWGTKIPHSTDKKKKEIKQCV